MQHLDSFIVIVIGFLLEVLLQERVGFCLLCSNTAKGRLSRTSFMRRWSVHSLILLWRPPAGFEGGVVSGRIGLVDTGAKLNVEGDQDHWAAEGSHLGVLCVHLGKTTQVSFLATHENLFGSSTFQSCLRDIRHSLAKHVHGDFITILVLPVGRLVPEFLCNQNQGKSRHLCKLRKNISPCPLHLAAWVGDHAGHDAADVVGQLVEVGHSGGVQQLVWNLIWMPYVFEKHMLQILRPSWDI